jgi:hypothetical protein
MNATSTAIRRLEIHDLTLDVFLTSHGGLNDPSDHSRDPSLDPPTRDELIAYLRTLRRLCPSLQAFAFNMYRRIDWNDPSDREHLLEFAYPAPLLSAETESGAMIGREETAASNDVRELDAVYRFDLRGLGE